MAEPSSFAGKVAVVTGAAQGVGEATARLMAARGAAGLALIDRQPERLAAVAADLTTRGTPVLCWPLDPPSGPCQFGNATHGAPRSGPLAHDALRARRVVPEIRSFDLAVERV